MKKYLPAQRSSHPYELPSESPEPKSEKEREQTCSALNKKNTLERELSMKYGENTDMKNHLISSLLLQNI